MAREVMMSKQPDKSGWEGPQWTVDENGEMYFVRVKKMTPTPEPPTGMSPVLYGAIEIVCIIVALFCFAIFQTTTDGGLKWVFCAIGFVIGLIGLSMFATVQPQGTVVTPDLSVILSVDHGLV